MRGIDIAHGDRTVHGRAETARRDAADPAAGAIDDLGAFAGRRTAVGLDADAQPLRTLGQFLLDARGARETAFGPPPLLDRPGEPGFDRRRGGVDVVAYGETLREISRLEARLAELRRTELRALLERCSKRNRGR